jgi:uncharacterized protein YjbJ (UPF0337 family)
LPNWQIRKG